MPITRNDFMVLTRLRAKEARVLLKNRCFEGAYYVLGYAIECALKACIAKKTRRYDFPPDRKVIERIYVHNLETLLNSAELQLEHQKEAANNPVFAENWAIVKEWSEYKRYSTAVSEAEARDFFSAALGRKNGVLPWLKKWW